MSRKALVVGIDNYASCPLHGCLNDAIEIASLLQFNEDGSKNFDVFLRKDLQSKDILLMDIEKLYSGDDDIALLYFSGHGIKTQISEFICTPDGNSRTPGVFLSIVLDIISKSHCKNKIVILDSYFSGGMGNSSLDSEIAPLSKGTTILTACKNTECSVEINGHGIFTTLLISALKGGARDLCGNITSGSIYAYIDKALGPWEQRPVFKTNVQEFISLRNVKSPINVNDLRSFLC